MVIGVHSKPKGFYFAIAIVSLVKVYLKYNRKSRINRKDRTIGDLPFNEICSNTGIFMLVKTIVKLVLALFNQLNIFSLFLT